MDELEAITISEKCIRGEECESCPLANDVILFLGDGSPLDIGCKIITSPCGIILMLKTAIKQLNEK